MLIPQHEEPKLPEARLVRCLDHLSERARTVLLLSFYAEENAAEIARELGTSAGNVRVMRHRALAELGACLEGR